MAEPYQSQVGTGSASLPGASAESFGAAVGRGLQDAGNSIERIKAAERQRDADEEAAAAGVQLANDGLELDTAAIEARSTAAPGGKGHSEAIAKLLEERQTAALGAIKDPRIRNAMQERYANLRERVLARERGWEIGERVNKTVADIDTTGTIFANQQAMAPDAASFVQAQHDIAATITLMSGIDDGTRTKAIKEQHRKIASAWGNAMQVKDPATLAKVLDNGLLNGYLEPEDINSLRSGALVEMRRLEAADKQKKSTIEAEIREEASTFRVMVSGGDMPDDAAFQSIIAKAQSIGDDSLVAQLKLDHAKILVNRETRTWTPPQFEATINALEAKGDKRSTAENVRLAQLKAIRPNREAAFASDPHAAAAVAGTPAPALDPAEPSSVQRRVTWAKAYAASTGLRAVPYLSQDELGAYRGRADDGVAGQLEVAGELRATFGVNAAAEISRQIDPNNKAMQLMVGLPPATARDYKVGAEAVKRNAKLFNDEVARETFEDYASAIPQELRSAVWDTARALAAAELDRAGTAEPKDDEFTAAFQRALHRAGGASGNAGGFVRWGARPIWIPPSMPKADALRRLSRAKAADIIAAHSDASGTGPGGAPYYMDGSGRRVKMTPEQAGQLIRQGRLETVNPGIYRVVLEDGGHVVNKNGGYWQFNIGKLP